ncbi:MAG: hypothetical protein AAGK02_08895, partial [Pseudomonadota bacterium]
CCLNSTGSADWNLAFEPGLREPSMRLSTSQMSRARRPFLLTMLLVAIGLRTALGAPCCLEPSQWAETGAHEVEVHTNMAHHEHATHADVSDDGHGSHGEGPASNPCCAACGPTLPADPIELALIKPIGALPEPDAIRVLATRPPFPAYDATGPPLLI